MSVWEILNTSDENMREAGFYQVIYSPVGIVAYVQNPNDARLIAAAPRMLEIIAALVSSPAMVDNDEPMMVEARAILRDVEGT